MGIPIVELPYKTEEKGGKKCTEEEKFYLFFWPEP